MQTACLVQPKRPTLGHTFSTSLPRCFRRSATPSAQYLCNWQHDILISRGLCGDHFVFTNEARFHLNAQINSQKRRKLSVENGHALPEYPLQSSKIGVWCVVSQKLVVGLLFFERAITSEDCDRGSTVVKVLWYKSEGQWFDPSWCHWKF